MPRSHTIKGPFWTTLFRSVFLGKPKDEHCQDSAFPTPCTRTNRWSEGVMPERNREREPAERRQFWFWLVAMLLVLSLFFAIERWFVHGALEDPHWQPPPAQQSYPNPWR